MKRVIIITLMLVFLGGCNPIPQGGIEGIMDAPVLSQMQKEIYEALESTLVDTGNIIYKYPRVGDEPAPFVFFDMDGDGVDEVVVFYAYSTSQKDLHANVLIQQNGKWQSYYDIPGLGAQVDFVGFSSFFQEGKPSLMIGWGNVPGRSDNMLSVYSLRDGELVSELESDYVDQQTVDLDGDGRSELVLVKKAAEGFMAYLYQPSGSQLTQTHWIPLFEDTTKILQVLVGTLSGGEKALYIDEEIGGSSISYSTEIVKMEKSGFTTLVGKLEGDENEAEWLLFNETFRTKYPPALSIDMDADGIIEVPCYREEENVADLNDHEDTPSLVEYTQYKEERLVVAYTATYNREFGYFVHFPERWIGAVNILKQPQKKEWRFYKIDPVTGENSTELFRIKVYYSRDYIDNATKDDTLLGTKGLNSYYGYIPPTENEPLAITEEDLETIFVLEK